MYLLIKMIVFIFGTFLFLVSIVVPKDKFIWIFGSWGGEQYSDNSRYLFEYINSNHPEITTVWLSRNQNIISMLNNRGFLAFKPDSIKGLLYSMRAKVGIITNGLIDINQYVTGRMLIVQLWHGIPLKPILYTDPKIKTKNNLRIKKYMSVIFPFLYKDINFNKYCLIASSEYTKNIFSKVFNTNHIQITGYPRNDGLLNSDRKIPDCTKDKINYAFGIYMPTYRQTNEFDIFKLFEKSIYYLENFLKKENIILYLKLHPFHVSEINIPKEVNHIRILSNSNIDGDIYSILNQFHFLITDYSSIMFDYLMLNRPIILVPFDLEQYVENNGPFIIDYDTLPFYRADTWANTISILKEIKKSNFTVSNDQIKYNKKINTYFDANNSMRVYMKILEKIKI